MKLILCLYCLILIGLLSGQTVVPDGSVVSGVWSADGSPYQVQGSVTVPTGHTLTVEPGVTLAFNSYSDTPGHLHVFGKLEAVGTAADSIRFTRDGNQGNWGAIHFEQADTTSILKYCSINYAGSAGESIYGSVFFDSCGGTIEKCSISNSHYYGLNLRRHGSARVIDCHIHDNRWSGIYGRAGSFLSVTGTSIRDNNDFGIYLRDASSGIISDCDIDYNTLDGIYSIEGSTPRILDNRIRYNGSSGIDVRSTGISIDGNTIIGNYYGISSSSGYGHSIRGNVIDMNEYVGIQLYSDAISTLNDNFISNSQTGIYVGQDATPTFIGNEISYCTTGIDSYRATSTIINCHIHDCDTGIYFNTWEDGAALCDLIENNRVGVYLYHHSCSELVNLTIVNCSEIGIQSYDSAAHIVNCIVADNPGENFLYEGDSTGSQISFSLSDHAVLPEALINLAGNLLGFNPSFTDAGNGDFTLTEDSPCIDTGCPNMALYPLPELDLAGTPRTWGGIIDMGAYEYPEDMAPTITHADPELLLVEADPLDPLQFSITATDIQPLTYLWYVDHNLVTCSDTLYTCQFEESGQHAVSVGVSDGTHLILHTWFIAISGVSIGDLTRPRIDRIAPNPFRNSTRIECSIPRAGRLEIGIYNLRGERIRTLVDAETAPGSRVLLWNGCDDRGRLLASGTYLCRMTYGSETKTRRLTLVR
jgi:parallel beta-helix repeat protein